MGMLRVLIVGNSNFPGKDVIDNLIENSNKIIACDGAIERCLAASIPVDYVVGDMDSLENTTTEKLSKLNLEIHKIDDQNDNDLQKAIIFSENLGADRIDIFGVEGGSNQHQFASYWCLYNTDVECYIHLSDCIVSIVKNNHANYSIETGREFSIFAIGICNGVNVSGGKWQVTDETLIPNSRGLHNLAILDRIDVSCAEGALLIFRSR